MSVALPRRIVIVGGGSAGCMTAAALSGLLDPKDVTITLVVSDAAGVGAVTIPDILAFNQMRCVGEAEFMAETQATFKPGIEFVDWCCCTGRTSCRNTITRVPICRPTPNWTTG